MAISENAIGQYIHFKYENYIKYGLKRKIDFEEGKTDTAPKFTQIFNEQRTLIKNFLNTGKQTKKQLQELERSLNTFFDHKGANIGKQGFTQEGKQVIQEKIIDKIREILDIPDEITITNNLQVFIGGFTSEEIAAELSKYKRKISSNKYTVKNALIKRFNILKDTYKAIDEKVNKDVNDLSFMADYERLKKEYETLYNEINNNAGAFERDLSHYKLDSDDKQNFIQKLNGLWETYKKTSIANIAGDIGEMYMLIASEVIKYQSEKSISEAIDKFQLVRKDGSKKWLGKERSASLFNGEKLFDIVGGKGSESLYKITGRQTQDKADIEITLSDGEMIKASVKNYNLNDQNVIHFLKGSNLLYTLQDYPIFLNHYLNITANKGRDNECKNANIIRMANDELRLSLLAIALRGNINKRTATLGSGLADILIVNNSGTGRVKVYQLSQVFEAVSKNINLLKVDGIKDDTSWENTFQQSKNKNNNYRSAYSRIMNLLFEIRKAKIEIMVKKDPFV